MNYLYYRYGKTHINLKQVFRRCINRCNSNKLCPAKNRSWWIIRHSFGDRAYNCNIFIVFGISYFTSIMVVTNIFKL